jgi:hypothetical protein
MRRRILNDDACELELREGINRNNEYSLIMYWKKSINVDHAKVGVD